MLGYGLGKPISPHVTWIDASHNPEVAGSNPAPAMRKAPETGPFLCCCEMRAEPDPDPRQTSARTTAPRSGASRPAWIFRWQLAQTTMHFASSASMRETLYRPLMTSPSENSFEPVTW